VRFRSTCSFTKFRRKAPGFRGNSRKSASSHGRRLFFGSGIHGPIPGTFGVEAIPAFVLVGPDGKIVARGMRGEDIKKAVARALAKTP